MTSIPGPTPRIARRIALKTPSRPPKAVLPQEIGVRSYLDHLCNQRGCPPGQERDNYLEAAAWLAARIPRVEARRQQRLHEEQTGGKVHRGFTMPPSDELLTPVDPVDPGYLPL